VTDQKRAEIEQRQKQLADMQATYTLMKQKMKARKGMGGIIPATIVPPKPE
jgi:hypothetical protein